MLKKFSLIIISLMITISVFFANSFAQDKQRIKIKQITGDIVAYDSSIKTMTVKGKRAEIIIILDEKTVIKEKKNLKSHSDIKVGDRVVIKYSEIEGKNIAKSIEIKQETKDNNPTK